ncbi:pyridine nucleotide-disulfide oxidoreductase, partial [Streptomyces rubiginosohelvolus]
TRAVRDGRVHLVGYGPSASTIGANRAGRAAVRSVMRLLKETGGVRAGEEAGSAGATVAASVPGA